MSRAFSIVPFHDADTHASRVLACLDLEFTRLPLPSEATRDWLARVRLLSLGMVAPGGETFYGRLVMTPALRSLCSAFTCDHVIPLLDRHPADCRANSEAELAAAATSFLRSIESRQGRPVALAADWDGDLVLMARLLGAACPRLLDADNAVRAGIDGNPACLAGLLEHQALDDAFRNARALGIVAMDAQIRAPASPASDRDLGPGSPLAGSSPADREPSPR